MRVDYVNDFVDAAIDILKETVTDDIKKGELSLRVHAVPMLGLAVIIGLTGKGSGRVVLDIPPDLGLKIASLMNKEEMKVFDEMATSTLTELANMIVGTALTKLHKEGYALDLTPPAIFWGDNLKMSDSKLETLIVPIFLLDSKLEINVALKE